MSRHVTSRHVTSCHILPRPRRGTVTRPTLHCQLTSSTRNQFKLSMTMFVGCPEGCRYNTASAVYDLVIYVMLLYYIACRCIDSISSHATVATRSRLLDPKAKRTFTTVIFVCVPFRQNASSYKGRLPPDTSNCYWQKLSNMI